MKDYIGFQTNAFGFITIRIQIIAYITIGGL